MENAVKRALLLGGAFICIQCLRRAPASWRHLVWVCVLTGLLPVMVWTMMGPHFTVVVKAKKPAMSESGSDRIHTLKHGFEYMSDIGVHPLGSRGSKSQPREEPANSPEPEVDLKKKVAVEGGAIKCAG